VIFYDDVPHQNSYIHEILCQFLDHVQQIRIVLIAFLFEVLEQPKKKIGY